MKKYFSLLALLVSVLAGAVAFVSCGDDDKSPEPSSEYTGGTFTFCYGAPESELDIAYFKFKFTFVDENGKEKTEEDIATKDAFTASNPDPTQKAAGFKFYKRPVQVYSLPASLRVETEIVLKGSSELTAEKYDIGQALFAYFQPKGAQLAQAWSGTLLNTKGVKTSSLATKLKIYQDGATNTFVIDKTGSVKRYGTSYNSIP